MTEIEIQNLETHLSNVKICIANANLANDVREQLTKVNDLTYDRKRNLGQLLLDLIGMYPTLQYDVSRQLQILSEDLTHQSKSVPVLPDNVSVEGAVKKVILIPDNEE